MLDQGTGIAGENCVGPGMLGLWYDPDRLMIEGVYQDELTAYRARRRWMEALKQNFLLEEAHDFSLKVKQSRGRKNFRVRCDFLTACGRYAFWRLTHHQAPEVQLLLETAHLPHSVSSYSAVMLADEDDMLTSGIAGSDSGECTSDSWRDKEVQTMLERVVRKLQKLANRLSSLTR